MKTNSKPAHKKFGLILVVAFACCATTMGQNGSGKEYIGPSADSIRPYKPAGKDPFKDPPKPKAGSNKAGQKANRVVQLGFPSLEVRRAQYRQSLDRARQEGRPDPHPMMQYLVAELNVTGIFRDDQGYGAFVQAQPTGSTFFIRRGVKCFNGEVLRIEGDESDIGSAKVVFRQTTYVEINGKQSPQEQVLAKLPAAPPRK
jgi:hypothetical protein